jgi:hypothetical protein
VVVDDNNMHTDIMHRHTPSYGLMNVDGVMGVHSLEIEQKIYLARVGMFLSLCRGRGLSQTIRPNI